MGKVWLTSDPHFNHSLVARIRGFETAEEHNAAVLDSMACVRKDDLTIWLGDLSLSRPREAVALVATVPGLHDLVLGNHDAHPMYRTAPGNQAMYHPAFRSVSTVARRKALGGSVLLSHFPYDGDHTTSDRETQYRLRDLGVPIVHGHTHSSVRTSRSAAGTLQVHVGWDAWRRPVDWDEVVAIIEKEQ